MKIYGPYTRKDNRKHIVIVHPDGRKQTKSYPRHLLEVHLGRELTDLETVDHIDNDFTNDAVSNLQVLSRKENSSKGNGPRERKLYHFTCPCCGKSATKFLNYVQHNWKQSRKGPYCSRVCAGKSSM